MSLQKQLQQVLTRREDLDVLKSSVYLLRQKLHARMQQSSMQHRATTDEKHTTRAQHHDEGTPLKTSSMPTDLYVEDVKAATNTLTVPTNEMASTTFMKVPPPPSVVSRMTEPPLATNQQHPSPTKSRHEAESRHSQTSGDGLATASPPKWYTKLRTQP